MVSKTAYRIVKNFLHKAYTNNDLYALSIIHKRKIMMLLTDCQKDCIMETAFALAGAIHQKIENGELTPMDLSYQSNATNCGASYTYYLRRYLIPMQKEKPDFVRQKAVEVFDNISKNPYWEIKGMWNEYFLILLEDENVLKEMEKGKRIFI